MLLQLQGTIAEASLNSNVQENGEELGVEAGGEPRGMAGCMGAPQPCKYPGSVVWRGWPSSQTVVNPMMSLC